MVLDQPTSIEDLVSSSDPQLLFSLNTSLITWGVCSPPFFLIAVFSNWQLISFSSFQRLLKLVGEEHTLFCLVFRSIVTGVT